MPGGHKNIRGTDGNTFKKGEVTNPNGRPKGFRGLTKTLRDIVEKDGTMIITDIIELESLIEDEEDKFGNKVAIQTWVETGKIIARGKIKIPKSEMIILAALKKAAKGDMRAVEWLFDRIEGKAKQSIEMESKQPIMNFERIETNNDIREDKATE